MPPVACLGLSDLALTFLFFQVRDVALRHSRCAGSGPGLDLGFVAWALLQVVDADTMPPPTQRP